ncbi:hypothetical protein MU582_19320 [Nocardioidaceae bacterium SCSIO 66511]|nr:hypothetical protein MU582_19320 [Nocardioidaceae bacterium SCSIO 66511]
MIEMVAAAGATIVAVAALIVSIKSLSIQKESARAATVSAEAAQRANVLTELRLERELGHDRDLRRGSADVTEDDPPPVPTEPAVPIEPTAPGGAPAPAAPASPARPAGVGDVRWTLDRRGKNAFVLRNTGSGIAHGVRIPAEALPPITRNLPESATLRPNESVEFLMTGVFGNPTPNEIPVLWDDNLDGVLVPVPGN